MTFREWTSKWNALWALDDKAWAHNLEGQWLDVAVEAARVGALMWRKSRTIRFD